MASVCVEGGTDADGGESTPVSQSVDPPHTYITLGRLVSVSQGRVDPSVDPCVSRCVVCVCRQIFGVMREREFMCAQIKKKFILATSRGEREVEGVWKRGIIPHEVDTFTFLSTLLDGYSYGHSAPTRMTKTARDLTEPTRRRSEVRMRFYNPFLQFQSCWSAESARRPAEISAPSAAGLWSDLQSIF